MSRESLGLPDALMHWMHDHAIRESEALADLREATASLPKRNMQIAAEQGQFMGLLVELIGAKRCIEVGTFTGYSALAVAEHLPDDGTIICCDVNEEWTALAQEHWGKAGLAHKMDLRLAPATETLDALLADGQSGSFDFAFIDADKSNYPRYFEQCLELVRSGGLIAIDNCFWDGSVADPDKNDEDTINIRKTVDTVHADERVTTSLVPIADGVLLARKR